MKLLVVSDSHGDRDILVTLADQFKGQVDACFHCGDSELPANDPLWATYHVVGGNMDFDASYPVSQTVTVDGKRIFLTHGHRYGIKQDLTRLALAAREAKANFAFFGHSHELGVVETSGIIFLNPGSISQPRGQYATLGGTFALVTSTGDQTKIEFCTRDGRTVPELTVTYGGKG
ncbi:metallophosphoesterase [Furfurilactobacillus milii]|uniref:Phosphoesterase n=1 Tax=Furfurilactobacillus milii TaxID=2888272 RepID=A0A6N9I4W0_9LACO|nr:metallophosphoesterase [Furfurilactobacillus milii]MYV18010.1 YfcE family phosphodiesterase [Furfurilactobacillus milii]